MRILIFGAGVLGGNLAGNLLESSYMPEGKLHSSIVGQRHSTVTGSANGVCFYLTINFYN